MKLWKLDATVKSKKSNAVHTCTLNATDHCQKFLAFHQFSMITTLLLFSRKKAKSFYTYLAKQCFHCLLMEVHYPCILLCQHPKALSVHFSLDEIRKIIIELGSNKVHRHDVTSICRLETCGESICKPLKLIFKSHLVQKIFLSE